MSQPFRSSKGSDINRDKPINFEFDGETLSAFEGDTLASALIAHGRHLVGRSFKYHRPRGFLAAGSDEPNALIQLDQGLGRTDPNSRATQIELFDGLKAKSQNRWPSLKRDIGVLNDLLSPMFPAGFYYKTFMWPRSFWISVYEPFIRKAAGLGEAPSLPDPDRYTHRYDYCDCLIVGAGPAGLMEAKKQAEAGISVILVDEQSRPGGALLSESGRLCSLEEGVDDWLESTKAELEKCENVRILSRTTATGYYDHNYVVALERLSDHLPPDASSQPRQRLWRIRAKEVVLATGSIERPLVFTGNDRPGIMLASAARTYLKRYGAKVGDEIILFTNNDSAYAAALDLADAGAWIKAIVDVRPDPKGELVQKARDLKIDVLTASVITGTEGRHRVHLAYIAQLNDDGTVTPGTAKPLACDCLLMSGGWNPNVNLFSQSKGKIRFNEDQHAFVPGQTFQNTRTIGAASGDLNLGTLIPGARDASEEPMEPMWEVPADQAGLRAKAFVDFQNDVTSKDLKLALREGLTSIEHVKRFTTTGMATDQGKTSNVNALAIVAGKLGVDVEEVGTTTFRPPYTPLTFGAIAGHHRGSLFQPVRKTPLHELEVEEGAVFEDVGDWKRAWYYPNKDESMHEAVLRECAQVREHAGMFDASTLGKIDLQGKDCREFLNRVYTNAWSKLAPGKCRYGLMLRDDGYVYDDGVTACLDDHHFHMTTTTGGAPRVLAWLEDLIQTEWTDLEVYMTSVTEQWAAIALQGPKARKILQKVTDDDVSAKALPHMAWMDATIAGVKGRIFRISFTGEAGFEINVPSGYARHVWQALKEAGEEHKLTLYGTETMHVLRAEKGYIIVGQETDGTTTPYDLGMDWIVSKKKKDFIGKRGMERKDLKAPGRKQLVGLKTKDPGLILDEGAQLVRAPDSVKMVGHVTSSYESAELKRSFALALLEGGHALMGQTIFIPQLDGSVAEAEICDTVFLDPKGERLHG